MAFPLADDLEDLDLALLNDEHLGAQLTLLEDEVAGTDFEGPIGRGLVAADDEFRTHS